MKLLAQHHVVALEQAADSALARFLVSLGATLTRTSIANAASAVTSADFFIEQVGTQTLAQAGLPRAQLEAINAKLIHVSVTHFGSSGPYAYWRGSE